MKSLLVVCPVFNEEPVILDFHEELRRALAWVPGWTGRVLYVVDRGTDRSLDLLRALAGADPAVSVLALSSRFGQQAALLAGLDHSDADAVVMLDSDLQHPPAVIPELVARHEQGFDVVYTVRERDASIPLLKRWSARAFYGVLNAVSAAGSSCVTGTSSSRVFAASARSRRMRSIARLRAVVTSHARGLAGAPSRGQRSAAAVNASCAASSARSKSPR